MLHLVFGAGGEGAEQALLKVFDCDLDQSAPHRSSFCRQRKQLSWRYFHDLFYGLIHSIDSHRSTFNGLRCYVIDGQQLTLPRTRDLYLNGFNGRFLEDDRETHTLKGYLAHCYDFLTGISKGFTFNNTLNEHRDRAILLGLLEEKSLVIYDRLYFSEDLVRQHEAKTKCYFLARCKKDASAEVTAFDMDEEKTLASTTRYGKPIHFIKVTHPKTAEIHTYATNLPENWLRPELIGQLYGRRWDGETAFYELTATLKCEQWHSKTLNGILQELYCAMWLINYTKICMLLAGEKNAHPLEADYEKANFKACCKFVVEKIGKYWNQPKRMINKLIKIVFRTKQKRKRYSRSYPREIKSPQSPYVYNNTRPSGADPPPGMRTSINPD
jgi:hypothetical protein